MKFLKSPIKNWNNEVFGNVDRKIAEFEEVAVVDTRIDDGLGSEVDWARRKALMWQLDKWYKRRADFWRQLAKERYFKEIDKNSKYFHTIANMKKRKKQILELKIEGCCLREPRRIKKEAGKYLKDMYKQKMTLAIES